MKNPNGYGTVFRLQGRRRRPYVARKTTGWNEKGHPIYFTIGYYRKKADALRALAEFNGRDANASDLDLTVEAIYRKWADENRKVMSVGCRYRYGAAKKWLSPVLGVRYCLLTYEMMQSCVDSCPNKSPSKRNIMALFRRLDAVADRLGIITRRQSAFLKVANSPVAERSVFSPSELRLLVESGDPFAKVALVLILSGFRKSELLNMRASDVHLDERWMKGGMKTAAGKDRVVPIHRFILPFMRELVLNGGGKVLDMKVYEFDRAWRRLMGSLGLKHIPHETRHTFRTLIDATEGNRRCIDLIMGHASGSIGERVYTHKTVAELVATVDLIDFEAIIRR